MKPEQLVLFERYADAVNADRYRVTSIKLDEVNGTKKTLILDKRDGVSLGFTREEVGRHMPEMLRLLRRGENLYYTPLSKDRHHILVDDVRDLFYLRSHGFRLAVVIESSPKNYQAIITIPKLGVPRDREIGNLLSNHFNQKYGDRRFFGCIHPHRAPGFKNFKLKHRDKSGNFPTVRLVESLGGECEKTLELSRKIYQELIDSERERKEKESERQWLPPPEIDAHDETAALDAYDAHFYDITERLDLPPHLLDWSRIDSMIALRMRMTGHSKHAIATAVATLAPQYRWQTKQGRDWREYARRTAEYAFSPAGDRQMDRLQRYIRAWRDLERERERESGAAGDRTPGHA
jgi:hypothetical protein